MSNLNNNTHIDLYGGANSSNIFDDDDDLNIGPIEITPSPEVLTPDTPSDNIDEIEEQEPELEIEEESELDLDEEQPELEIEEEEEPELEIEEEEEPELETEEEEQPDDALDTQIQVEDSDNAFFEEIKNDINEFILDDEDFQIIETEQTFAITEETAIPEYKIIYLDTEQEEDVINELIKKLPIKDRNNKKHLLEIRNTIEHFINLKKNHSNFNINNEAISPKFLGDKYKPLVENYYNDKFSNKYLIPIIDTKKIIYKDIPNPQNEKYYFKYFNSISEDDLDTNTNVLLYNINTINSQSKIINKYRKSSERLNYKYQNELNELLSSINDIYYINTKGYSSKNIHDTFTISNIFEDDISINYSNDVYKNKKYNKQIIMGSDYFNDNLLYPNNINKIGFVKPSDEYLNEVHYLKNTLLEVANSCFIDKKDLNIDNAPIEIVNIDYKIGDSVKLCFIDNETQLELFGTIINIEDDDYIIKPKDYSDVKQYGSLIINKKDKSVIIFKNEQLKKEDVDNKRNCYSNTPIIYKFQDDNINSETYKNILDNIIPENKSFIVNNLDSIKNSNNFKDINHVLNKYSISINDLTSNTFKIISDILTQNNNTIINESDYNKFEDILKNIKNTYSKNPIKLITKKLLKQLEPYYGNYPYYNTPLDTLNVRLSWIHSQIDNGVLFYKTIILENYSKIFSSTQATKNGIVKQIQDYNKQLDTLNKKINKEVVKYSTKDDCAELIKYRIVKKYKSIIDLENDNYDVFDDVIIDDDKKLLNDPDNLVKVGHYCILEDNGNNKIYKRELISSRPMWIFQNSMSVDSIIKNNSDFCNLQKLNYNEITSAILSSKKSCKYSDISHKCINRELFGLLENAEDIINKIKEKGKMLSLLDENENILEYIKVFKQSLEFTLKKYNLSLQNKFKKEKTKYEKYIKQTYDDEYSSLYTKIDKYLSKISLFEPDEYYKNLEVLISKYGRDAYTNENKRNVYCKVGNKVIICKHHTYMIDFFKNPSNSGSILEFLKQEYGIIDNGNVFCSNCGQEIYIDEYETIEGFASNGAHIITHETLDTPDDTETDLFETTNKITAPTELLNISSFMDEATMYNKDNSTTMKVSNFILKLIGVKLNSNDLKSLIDRTNNSNKSSIKTQFNWLKAQKRVPKDKTIIEKAYNNYKTRTEIINTIGNLFIILQTSIPPYKITKTHAKCSPSLLGFPLVDKDEDISGIQYFTCILENLRESGKLWTSLKKVNIQDTLLNFLERNIKDAFIGDLYVEKRIYLQKLLEIKQNIKIKNIWNEFKPPLDKLVIKLDCPIAIDFNDNLKQYNLHKTLLALKTIENIDNTINISNVENQLYNPTPLGNTCCLDKLTPTYDYSNYFNEYTPINALYQNIDIMDKNTPKYNSVNVLFKFLNRKNKLESFQDDVFPIKDTDIDIDDVKLLYITFISEGEHIGKRHVYDENGICLYTGENIEEIKNKKYTMADYNKFYNNINKSKIFAASNGNNKNDLISNILKVRDMNPLLKTNEYFNKLIDNIENALKTNVLNLNDIYDDLEAQNTLNINNIVEKIRTDTNISQQDSNNIIQILENIGSLNNILEEDTILYGDIQAKQNFYIKQCELIKTYTKYLHNITYYIKEDYTPYSEDIVDTFIKETKTQWNKSRLQKTHLDTLKNTYNTKREKYLKMKNKLKGDTKATFSNIYNIIENSLTGINIINGKPHIYDCKGDIKYFSELTYYNASLILKYLFINTIDIIINNETVSNPLGETLEFSETPEFSDEDLQEDEDIDFIGNIQNNNSNKSQFIINLSKYIQENQSYYDKFTNENINEAIDKKSDIEKEKNLKFIEDLNEESRQSFKVMIKFGLETWKNLSSKNKDLYFERPIPEETVELTESDLDERNRTLAAQELGENYTEDDYELWTERQAINNSEDRLAYEERDILPDIEDDAYDGNAEGYDESLIYN